MKKNDKGAGAMEKKKYWNTHRIPKFSICVLLSMALVCIIPTCWAAAASTPTLSVSADAGSAATGQTVNVNVSLSNNPAVTTLGMALDYDSSVLQYAGSTWNSAFGSSDMTLVSDDGGSVNLSAVCDNVYTSDGVVVTVQFEAVSDASQIPVSLQLRDMTDGDLEAVNCRIDSQLRVPQVSEKAPETVDQAVDEPAEPAQNVSRAPAQSTQVSNSGADENYKTGAGLGNDIYLIAAAFCGILALAVLCRNEKKRTR